MRRELSSSQVEAISDSRKTTTRGRAVTWMASKPTVNISDGKGEAMEASDLHWLSPVGPARYSHRGAWRGRKGEKSDL